MGRPRPQKKAPRPSPLAQVQFTRPISATPEMGLVRDPEFWKRFSAAAHQAEEKEIPQSSSSRDSDDGDHWLAQQHREKRRCRCICLVTTLIVALLITAGAVVAWYFTKYRKLK
ncbi:hypothetical protein BP6252_09175 [Coleophoma cylindrospora]|uniref:Uncharacterized protein n=1 Tax=Coleophoma cylindrospora TaxID=1849047 RepID=A0A3D8R170_9HELO|nr:hypothetical protein BP6252_09175 [Coleophoma cylindrospora]